VTNMPMFPEHASGDDDTPLPLIVAKKWGFPLAFHIVEGKYVYAIHDWVRGLLEEQDIRHIWLNFKKLNPNYGTLFSTSRMAYKTSNGRTHMRDFTTDAGLYLFTQRLRITTTRPILEEIRNFLAASGAFVDEVRLDPTTVLTSGAMTPDQAIDAGIAMYRAQGKDDEWIQARLDGKIKRNHFIIALKSAVADMLTPHHYATATDDIYRGLWGRTASHLRKQLELPKKASLRDHQPMLGLEYQRIAEGASAKKLGQRQELNWDEARDIVKMVAAFVGRQAKEMSELLEMDLATGFPLLITGS
jgi:hypothetical protein